MNGLTGPIKRGEREWKENNKEKINPQQTHPKKLGTKLKRTGPNTKLRN